MTETDRTIVLDDMTEPALELPDLTDDQIKTAFCYVDAKNACAENPELNFPDAFSASWSEMLAEDAEDAETDDPERVTVAQLCQWFRQGLAFVKPPMPAGDST